MSGRPPVAVRAALPADVPAILGLIRALAGYERQPDAVETDESALAETLFAADARVFARVATLGNKADAAVIGMAIWFLNYSTWTGRPGLYLEDLFVDPAARRTGAATALMRALAREALDRGCARLDWAVLDWNESAMRFYRAIGGRRQNGWQPWRIEGDALATLAG